MSRSLPVLCSFLLLIGCASAKPADVPDPTTEPTIASAIEETAEQAGEEAERGALIGRRVGRVAGVFAAVLGGPSYESTHDMLERYRNTRDAVEATGALIGAAHGGRQGAKRGLDFDQEFAELQAIDGVIATRPLPRWIELRLSSADAMPAVARVLLAHEERAIGIVAPEDLALEVREQLIDLGVNGSGLSAHRDDAVSGIVMRIGFRD